MASDLMYTRESWSGDSKDGVVANGDGFHFFCMDQSGLILEAYEVYENDDGDEVVTPLPEMHHIGWKRDFGFEDFEALDLINEEEFCRVKELSHPLRAAG